MTVGFMRNSLSGGWTHRAQEEGARPLGREARPSGHSRTGPFSTSRARSQAPALLGGMNERFLLEQEGSLDFLCR